MSSFFLGLTLPGKLRETIESERRWMQKKWGNRSGMKTEPHITLIPPFDSDLSLHEINQILSDIVFPPVEVSVSGYGSFGERTIFAHVERSRELEDLVREISKTLCDNGIRVKEEKRYTPHITIANRDIKPYSFIPSMEYLNSIEINETFSLNSFMIFFFKDYSWIADERYRVTFSS